MYQKYSELRNRLGFKDADVSRLTGIPRSTFSDWKSGRSKPKSEKLQKIASLFKVDISYFTIENTDWEPSITDNDEKDIKKALDAIKNQLSTGTGLMYDGEPMDDEDMEAVLAAIEVAERTAILAAKKKFTPKKYQK